jgi:hypothetical protein
MNISFAIPKQFTRGDRVVWSESISGASNAVDVLSCFIRGQSSLDLTGVGDSNNLDTWNFEIVEAISDTLIAGIYQAQFVLYSQAEGKKTLGMTKIEVCASFANLTSLDTRLPEEKELEEIDKAISALSNGVAEYYIGTRKVRYIDVYQLYERQRYLRNRIAKIKNRCHIGGVNVGINFDRG